ncbi:MAG: Asp-tRNA(Asn)/Glu-tRNA(Gln) amidotransferase subunit GatA [Bacilli bacterium]|nr:Asp-tRNA(Asn)/Glu-tRNA(Gln) amidotransferase subunit GatA [Bacilli bacterium]
MTNYLDLSLIEINNKLKNREIKPIDLVMECFSKIENNEDLNCFITLNKEEAIKKALELENKEVDNILFAIPIAIKDNIITKGLKTTCGSNMLNNFIPTYDAYVINKINNCNMIVIGKTNMDEFAMGSSNQTSYFGCVLNAWNKSKVSGGSSGGSAVSVSSRIVPFALGSDTGGSIRQPSAFNGIVGLKPTYGRVSRYGLVSFASSLDQIGPMSRNVLENSMLLNCIVGKDNNDLTSCEKDSEDFSRLIGEDIKGIKIAIPNFYVNDNINEDIKSNFNNVVNILKNKGVNVDYVDIDYIEYSVPLYQIIALAEASSNLARFDGIRYGYCTDKKINNADELYKYNRGEGFGEEVKRRIMIGSYVLSGDNVQEYYYKALSIRKIISDGFSNLFKNYDYIIGPTTTTLPYNIGEGQNDAVKSFFDDLLTIPVNMAGLPAMSLPIGINNNLPIGMQIICNKFEEAKIYKLASFIEKELNLNLDPRGDLNE